MQLSEKGVVQNHFITMAHRPSGGLAFWQPIVSMKTAESNSRFCLVCSAVFIVFIKKIMENFEKDAIIGQNSENKES